jgi:dihydrofolate synthase / folylpolyglutamate synthase
MKIAAYKTDMLTNKSHSIEQVLDFLPPLKDGLVIAITSKVVSLCEGRAVSINDVDKDELIKQESQKYLPRSLSSYNVSFTIARNMLLPTAGIDESNADGHYVLWPDNLQASANMIREYLMNKHDLKQLGVIITDSTTRAMQWGVTGISLAFSGFVPLKDYIGQPDLFGRPMQFETASIANGLAAAATLMMGEGTEQTPLAVIEDAPVTFRDHNPTQEELNSLKINPKDDLYWPLIQNAPWLDGDQK